MNNGILTEHNIKSLRRKGHWPRHDFQDANFFGQPGFCRMRPRMGKNCVLNVNARHIGRAVFFNKQDIDAPYSAANIQNGLVAKVDPLQQSANLFRPPRRQPAVAPDVFEHADHLVVIKLFTPGTGHHASQQTPT